MDFPGILRDHYYCYCWKQGRVYVSWCSADNTRLALNPTVIIRNSRRSVHKEKIFHNNQKLRFQTDHHLPAGAHRRREGREREEDPLRPLEKGVWGGASTGSGSEPQRGLGRSPSGDATVGPVKFLYVILQNPLSQFGTDVSQLFSEK